MIPFEPITLEKKREIERFFFRYGEGSCQHSFVSSYCMSVKYGDMACVRNHFLYILRLKRCTIELRKVLSECPEIESVEEITVHDYGPSKKIAVAAVHFAKSCNNEIQCKSIDNMLRFCKDKMNLELSLYGTLYKQAAIQGE